MKISELAKRTKIPKKTIHYYYVREGLIPNPGKIGRNGADNDELHAGQIQLTRHIQTHFP
jgi:DNA-binding transcriptional MerR regulator